MKFDSVALLFGLCASVSAAPAELASEQDLTRRQIFGGGSSGPFAPATPKGPFQAQPKPNNNPFQAGGRNPPPGPDPFQSGGRNPPPQAPGNPFNNGRNPPPQAPGNPFQSSPRPPNNPSPRPPNNPAPVGGNPRNPFQPQPAPGPSSGSPAVEGAIKSTGQALEALYNELKGWNRLPKGQENPAVKRAFDLQDNVLQLMRRGSADIRRGPNIASAEANRMREWLGAVTDLFSDSMDKWIDYKRIVVSSRARPNVYQQLRDLQTALTEWNSALIARLPTLSTLIQGTWRARQVRQIERAVLEYRND